MSAFPEDDPRRQLEALLSGPQSDEPAHPRVALLTDFFSSVLARLDERDAWNPHALHPSDLGAILPLREDGSPEGCPRKVWLRVHGAKANPKSDGTRLMLETGKWKHAILQSWLADHHDLLPEGWSVAGIEERVSENEEGTLDLLMQHQSPCPDCPPGQFNPHCPTCDGDRFVIDLRVVYDFKTMNGSGFVFLIRDGQAKPAHILQARSYMKSKNADLGVVVYIDREGSQFMWQSPPFGRDDAAVAQAWGGLHMFCGPEAPEPKPLRPVLKKGLPTLPWVCRYHDRTGKAISCEYLDVSCPGALAPADRPETTTKWTPRKVVTK